MDKLEHYYSKILLWSNLGDEIINFGMQCGITNLMDYIDMNCGAVAEGNYSNVIDPDAPEQFLSLYANIARKRFAFAVTQVLKMGEEAKPVIKNFIHDVGKNNGGFSLPNAKEGLNALCAFVLEELPGQESCNEIISVDENSIKWKKKIDLFSSDWTDAGSDVSIYRELEESFINGLFENTGFVYSVKGNVYSIVKA